MKKSKVYTGGGDKGETSLVSGNRVSKGDHRIHTYGEVDELNSHLGVVLSLMKSQVVFEEEYDTIEEIQCSLFDLGSNLACEEEFRSKYQLPQLSREKVEVLEKVIDRLDSQLPALKNFILPGGSIIASHLHVARTFCRRIERDLVAYERRDCEILPDNAVVFINRLSDYLFVMARYVNFKLHVEEVLWKNR